MAVDYCNTASKNEWRDVKLGNVCTVLNGRAYKQKELLSEGKYPVLRVGNFFSNRSWYYSNLELDENKYCNNGDLLYAWSASFGPRIWEEGKVIYHYHIWKMVVDESILDKNFLFYWLDCDTAKMKSEQGSGSTMVHVTKGSMEDRNLILPPLPEQKRIAEVLRSVDEAIAKTEAVIAQTQRVKQGLLQTLLTRGIGHTKFKQTKIGEIPEDWEIETFDSSAIDIIDGDRGKCYPKQNDFSDSGYCLFLSATNVTKNGFVFNTCAFITKSKDEALRKGKLKRHDIILTTRGTVGNLAYYNEHVPYDNIRINSGMVILRNNSSDWSTDFIYNTLREWLLEWEYKRVSSGSAQPQLPIKDLKKFRLIKPPLNEQIEINGIIKSINHDVESSQRKLTQLKQLKKGLMADLLTGRVRVNVGLDREEEAA